MARTKVAADYTRLYGIAKKKSKKRKGHGKILQARLKNNILRSLGGPGIRKVQRSGIYNSAI